MPVEANLCMVAVLPDFTPVVLDLELTARVMSDSPNALIIHHNILNNKSMGSKAFPCTFGCIYTMQIVHRSFLFLIYNLK